MATTKRLQPNPQGGQPKGHAAEHSTDHGMYPNMQMGASAASIKMRRPSTKGSGLPERTHGMGPAPAQRASH